MDVVWDWLSRFVEGSGEKNIWTFMNVFCKLNSPQCSKESWRYRVGIYYCVYLVTRFRKSKNCDPGDVYSANCIRNNCSSRMLLLRRHTWNLTDMVFNMEQPCLEMGFVWIDFTFFFLEQFLRPYPSKHTLGSCCAELSEQSVSHTFGDMQPH